MTANLNFIEPPPGLEPLLAFSLDPVAGAAGLYTLRDAQGGGTRLFVLDAGVFLPDYSPELSDEQAESLELERPEDAVVLVVANPAPGGTTVNLLAPIVVNRTTGTCMQVILEDQDWPLRAELPATAA